MDPDDTRAVRRRRAGEGIAVLTLIVVGTIVVAAGGDVGVAIGSALIGIGGVVLVSAVFYEIGAGEDRDRAREQRASAEPRKPPAPPARRATWRAPRRPE